MKILIVTMSSPYPPHDGGKTDNYNRLKNLHALGFDITLISFYNPALSYPEKEPLLKFCKEVYFLPYLRRQLSKIFHWKPYFIKAFENWGALNIIQEALKTRTFSFILSESHHVLEVCRSLQKSLNIPKLFLRSQNNEPKFMLSMAQTYPVFSLKKIFFLCEALKYRLYMPFLMKSFTNSDKVLHISYDEYVAEKQKYPFLDHHFFPAGIDIAELIPHRQNIKPYVLFIGALYSPNNLHGLKWYFKNIHQRLVESIPDYKLMIAGNTKGANVKDYQFIHNECGAHCVFYDTPKDLDSLYRQSQVFINPMRYGAGVKLKTVHALLKGCPIVTTSTGNEGTGFQDNHHVLVNDDPAQFFNSIKTLLLNPQLGQTLVEQGQEYLKNAYGPGSFLNALKNE